VNGPQSVQLHPFKEKVWRKAKLLDPLQYAVVQNEITAEIRHEEGPQLLFLGSYDDLRKTMPKLVLEKHEYVRLVDRKTGFERVAVGPKTVVPSPTEVFPEGIKQSIFLDTDSAVVVLNKTTGMRRLLTTCDYPAGVYAPQPLEEVDEVRSLIHVLPHEAMIVRDVAGAMTVYSGAEHLTTGSCGSGTSNGEGTAFFLPPYSKIVRMFWSSYPNPNAAAPQAVVENSDSMMDVNGDRIPSSMFVTQSAGSTRVGLKVPVVKIDLRARKAFYKYEVRTSDNVKLRMEGAIFWQVTDVRKMINMTSDPEGDIWHHSRSILIGAVSNVTLDAFMSGFNTIVDTAFQTHASDDFYRMRGVTLQSMELTRYDAVDAKTVQVLQNIIRETTNRLNKLQRQNSDNEVRQESLTAEIALENNRTLFIETEALNRRLLAESRGAVDGGGVSRSIASFFEGLNATLPNSTAQMELYRLHIAMNASAVDTKNLAGGSADLYVAPKDMTLKLLMPGVSTARRLEDEASPNRALGSEESAEMSEKKEL